MDRVVTGVLVCACACVCVCVNKTMWRRMGTTCADCTTVNLLLCTCPMMASHL